MAGRYDDSERLPWLETVEEAYQEPRRGRAVLFLLLALLVAGGAGAFFYWQRHQSSRDGNGALIAAPPGPYKVRPDDPGGVRIAGEGDIVFQTSQGTTPQAGINVAALPETPVEGTKHSAGTASSANASKSATIALPPPSPARPTTQRSAAAAPARAGEGAGELVQLGAFPSEGAANIAWTRMSKRFTYLAPLGKLIVPFVTEDGKTVYRLRVNAGGNGQARDLCGKLKVAGENCFVAS
ncbi:SPOR domain-containing protein [Sphingomonas pokkalii]|uniref:SPOR domain-containing protein n=1 Tax=Sphingomonas pokkalii TaxID=2175090 RepID=A0A2U0SHC1_9SPHN|nr:SPOR domain-containing protein [Sphingomonas pokkalii]PVX30749.1 SPOR domain-containing protein [Sphingomonas pokkalii]